MQYLDSQMVWKIDFFNVSLSRSLSMTQIDLFASRSRYLIENRFLTLTESVTES